MRTVYLNRNDPTVLAVINATFRSYNGRRIEAVITDRINFYNTQWDEGSRRDYKILRLADMKTFSIPEAPFLRKSEMHENTFEIPPGFVVVVERYGRYPGLEIHGPTDNVSKLLPAPTDLTDDERTVLAACKGFKSSYGDIKDYRFHEARRYTSITRERYDAAKEQLIKRRFLNKAGAITNEGRNAIGNYRLGYASVPEEPLAIGN